MSAIRTPLRSFFACFAIALASSTALSAHAAKPNLHLLYDALAADLKRGGYAIFVVVPDTIGQDEKVGPAWWKNCATSRMVSPKGMEQLRAISAGIVATGARIGMAHSSEVCAALTTATYTNSNPNLRTYPTGDLNPVEIQRQAEQLTDSAIQSRVTTQLLLGGTWAGTVTVLSGHRMTPETAPHPVLAELEPGETAVFKPDVMRGPQLVARLNWKQWQEMAQYLKRGQKNTPRSR